MIKRFAALLLVLLLISNCFSDCPTEYTKYQHYFFGTFDTMVSVIAYAKTEEEFTQYATLVENEMLRYHRIFDQYNDYEGIANLYKVNAFAGIQPTQAEPELIELLLAIRQWRESYDVTAVNPAMGSVLQLWHDAREEGVALPDKNALLLAAQHTDFNQVIVDRKNQTIAFADPAIKLDVGAVAKGYAAQLVADKLRSVGLVSFIINAGGNVVCGDAPLDGRTQWTIAIEAIDGVTQQMPISALNEAVVTSGDYQRYYVVDGKNYHHLIDPQTLYPANYVRAVSIVHPDSGLSDFLSTAAFLLPYEESFALIDRVPGAEARWAFADGTEKYSDGFSDRIVAPKN